MNIRTMIRGVLRKYFSYTPVRAQALPSPYSAPQPYVPDTSYTFSIEKKRRDFTHNIPLKNLSWEPKSQMGGVLGFTYLGAGTIHKRDDLIGNPALSYEVDVHESIHTDSEYETRVLTAWMLSQEQYSV